MDLAVNLLDPKSLIATFGIIGIFVVLFAETGLLVGFFLPGDTLLFSAGIFTTAAATDAGLTPLPLPVLMVGAPLSAIVGAEVGYLLGVKYGRRLFERPKSRLFRQEHVDKAEHYFEKFGPSRAVVLARFIPIVRTFLNPLAGMLEMGAIRFFVWNVVGAVLWTESVLLVGRFLGDRVEGIDKYILPVVALAVLVSVIPVVREMLKGRKRQPDTSGPAGRDDARPSADQEDAGKTAGSSGRHRR